MMTWSEGPKGLGHNVLLLLLLLLLWAVCASERADDDEPMPTVSIFLFFLFHYHCHHGLRKVLGRRKKLTCSPGWFQSWLANVTNSKVAGSRQQQWN